MVNFAHYSHFGVEEFPKLIVRIYFGFEDSFDCVDLIIFLLGSFVNGSKLAFPKLGYKDVISNFFHEFYFSDLPKIC